MEILNSSLMLRQGRKDGQNKLCKTRHALV